MWIIIMQLETSVAGMEKTTIARLLSVTDQEKEDIMNIPE